MPALSPDRIAHLLQPFLKSAPAPLPETLFLQLSLYLDLLLKWNARTNLTAIHDPQAIVTRHFGESLFLACHLPVGVHTILDLGSGAGFPGIPLHLLRPDLTVTLAESQGKKAAFLREAVRSLALSTFVHAGRAEDLVGRQRFDIVTLRAVDNMTLARRLADQLGTSKLILTSTRDAGDARVGSHIPIPQTTDGVLLTLP